MQLGMCSWSYHRDFESGKMDIFEWMTICARDLKVHGIEITDTHMQSTDEDYVKTVKRVAVDMNLTIAALTVSNDFGKELEEDRTKELEKIERAIETAAELGAPILRIFAGWPEGFKEKSARERADQWNEMLRCMSIAGLLADRYGVVLAVENHNHGGFLQTGDDVMRLLADADSEWLRLNLDTGNYVDGFESIEKTLVYAVHIHAKMMDINEQGLDFTTDYPQLIKLLHESNYRGFVSIEYEGEEESLTAVPRGLEYLRRLVREAQETGDAHKAP
jgi:sugar phosphate isomerase/epimerase